MPTSRSLDDFRKESVSKLEGTPPHRSPGGSPLAHPQINRLREEHAEELQTVLNGHARTVETLRDDHTVAMDEFRAALDLVKSSLQNEIDDQRSAQEILLAKLNLEHARELSELNKDHEMMSEAMETSLSSSEEHRRQMKMKADQALFELSRVRDEHQAQRNLDGKRMAELIKVNTQLERIKLDLETAKVELSKRVVELEQRYSRKASPLPPQGPPPSSPLPPTPAFMSASVSAPVPSSHLRETSNGSTSEDGRYTALSETNGSNLSQVILERDELKNKLDVGEMKIREAVSGILPANLL